MESFSNKLKLMKNMGGGGGIFKLISFPMEDSLSEAIALDINQIRERSDTCLGCNILRREKL